MPISRRRFTTGVLLSALATRATQASEHSISGALRRRGEPAFQHGIASGDPLADRVVLWTRVTPRRADRSVAVRYRIASDPALRRILQQGEVEALPQRDFTVKLDVLGLSPGSSFYYGFEADDEASPIGRTRTLPVGVVTQVRLAAVSCSNLPFGYFNVYANIAARDDLDAVLHLGDYLYEYGPREWGDGSELNRAHLPAHELLSLADYRQRHAQYKADIDLQAAHRRHPWITVWDDHETANNSWMDGASNHNPERNEGTWRARETAAIRAYAEWMPIRELPDEVLGLRTWRHFAFGDLADLMMLDTRLHGRARQVVKTDLAALADPARSMLGADQEAWLATQLRQSKARGSAFRLLGQQVMMGQLLDADRRIVNSDMWDGYPVARQRIFEQLGTEKIDNVVVLSGDIHSAWALDLTPTPLAGYDPHTRSGALAVEFVTPSVTSPPPFRTAEEAALRERSSVQNSPHVKWVNFRNRGYLVVDVTPERAQGEWYFVDSVATRGAPDIAGAVFANARGAQGLVRVDRQASAH